MSRLVSIAIVGWFVLTAVNTVNADTFGVGENTFEIEFVTIGDPGNAPDTTGDPNPAGAVDYVYQIGKYEISEQMIEKANLLGDLGITKDARGPDKPATRVSWFEAAKFVNWLNTSTGKTPAYKFDDQGDFQLWELGDPGYDPDNLFRNRQAMYFLPSADEWYKAAFYDPEIDDYWDYPNGSNEAPAAIPFGTDPNTAVYDQSATEGSPADITLAGGSSLYGTIGQAGNVGEWNETDRDMINDVPDAVRGLRGGSWANNSTIDNLAISSSFQSTNQLPSNSIGTVGFRVARIPEPSTEITFVAFCIMSVSLRWKRRLMRRICA